MAAPTDAAAPADAAKIDLDAFRNREVIGFASTTREIAMFYESTEEENFVGIATWVIGEARVKRSELPHERSETFDAQWNDALRRFAPVHGVEFTRSLAKVTVDGLDPCAVRFQKTKVTATCGSKTATSELGTDVMWRGDPYRAFALPGIKRIVVTYEKASTEAGSDHKVELALD